MKKILMLGTSSGSVEMIEYAKSIGVYTVVTDYLEPEESNAKLIADESWMISTADLDKLAEKCVEEGITGVLSGVSDFNVTQAVKLSERIQTPFYCDSTVWAYSRNKAAFKEKCRKYGVPTAKQYFVSDIPTDEEIDNIDFPVVVKPIDASANRGFSYCYNKQQFIKGYEKAKEISVSGNIVVEKLLKGKEYTAFYALADGEARLVNFWTMLSQSGMPENCYSVNMSVSDVLNQYNKDVDFKVKRLLKELGYRDGIVWIEFMADEDNSLNALEIGHRLSGEMLWLPLSNVRDFNAMKWLVDYVVNGKNEISNLPCDQADNSIRCACSYILWTKQAGIVKSVNGFDDLLNIRGRNVNIIAKIGKHIDIYRYGAIVTFYSDDIEQMIADIKYIDSKVKILDQDGNDMLIHFDDFEKIRKIYKHTV